MATAPFGKEKKGEVGVERLVDEGVYTAAFPLHDVSPIQFLLPTRNPIMLLYINKTHERTTKFFI